MTKDQEQSFLSMVLQMGGKQRRDLLQIMLVYNGSIRPSIRKAVTCELDAMARDCSPEQLSQRMHELALRLAALQ